MGNALSRTFSGFSDTAQTHGHMGDESVFYTYETSINNSGGVRIQNVKSYVVVDYEDCYSISSIYNEPCPPNSGSVISKKTYVGLDDKVEVLE